jgi:hypothetical protein
MSLTKKEQTRRSNKLDCRKLNKQRRRTNEEKEESVCREGGGVGWVIRWRERERD